MAKPTPVETGEKLPGVTGWLARWLTGWKKSRLAYIPGNTKAPLCVSVKQRGHADGF
jgi:hypothetical protein